MIYAFANFEFDTRSFGLRTLVEWPGEPGIMRALAASVLVRLLARCGRHDEAADVLRSALANTAGSAEIALVGPVTAAALEAAWLSGRRSEMPAIAESALALQRAGLPVDVPADAVGPWAHSLAGRWREAADAWAAHGCRYERALELALAPESSARTEGRAQLRSLGATAALAVVG